MQDLISSLKLQLDQQVRQSSKICSVARFEFFLKINIVGNTESVFSISFHFSITFACVSHFMLHVREDIHDFVDTYRTHVY